MLPEEGGAGGGAEEAVPPSQKNRARGDRGRPQPYKSRGDLSSAKVPAMDTRGVAAAMRPLVLLVAFLCTAAPALDTCPGESDAP